MQRKVLYYGLVLVLLGCIAGIYKTVRFTANHYLPSQSAQSSVDCIQAGPVHMVVIKNGNVSPAQTKARACDRLTIRNDDDTVRLIAFGNHEHHTAYDGVTEQALTKGQSFTVGLYQGGTYTFHDHLHSAVAGSFTVAY